MKISSDINNNELIFKTEGKLNSLTADDFKEKIDSIPKNITNVTLDFSGLTYMSSIGIVLILSLKKKLGESGTLKIVHAEGLVKNVIELSGFDKLLVNDSN